MYAAIMYYQHVRKCEETGINPYEYNDWLRFVYLVDMH